MIGKKVLFVLQLAIALLTVTVLNIFQATAQSLPQQQPKPAQTKASGNEEMINPDRPGLADGSAVIGANRLQIEGGFQEEFRRQDGTRQHTIFIPTLLRIGINSHWEARVEGNTFSNENDINPNHTTTHVTGVSPLSFGLKYQIEDSQGVRHPSVGAIFRVFPVMGASDFRTHHVTGDLRLAADWDFAPRLKLSLNPNVGLGIYEDDIGKAFAAGLFAMTLNYQPRKNLNPFIDVGLQAPEEREGKAALIVDGGVAYIVGHNLQLDVSLGTGAHGSTPAHPFVSLGLSLRSHGFRHKN